MIVFHCAVTDFNGRDLGLTPAEHLLLLEMRTGQLAEKPAMSRADMLDRVTFEERTLDGVLASLKRRGLIERRVQK